MNPTCGLSTKQANQNMRPKNKKRRKVENKQKGLSSMEFHIGYRIHKLDAQLKLNMQSNPVVVGGMKLGIDNLISNNQVMNLYTDETMFMGC